MFPPDSTTHVRKDRTHGPLLTPSELGAAAVATRRHLDFWDPTGKISSSSRGAILPGGEIVENHRFSSKIHYFADWKLVISNFFVSSN